MVSSPVVSCVSVASDIPLLQAPIKGIERSRIKQTDSFMILLAFIVNNLLKDL
jgi:hypothetical protein